jgi:hypothetical protein
LFTHIATGRLILESGVPLTDPYSWTMGGEKYIAQSWLASWGYAMVEGLGDGAGIRLLGGAAGAAAAALAWVLSRPAQGLLARFALVGGALAVESAFLVPRPAAFGLVGYGLVMLAVWGTRRYGDECWWRLPPPWMALVGAVWVNVHGSWLLGLAICVGTALGRLLDRDDPWPALRSGGWLAGGVVAGALASPVGSDLIGFPAVFLARSSDLSNLYEFQRYQFDDGWQFAGVALVALAVLGLVRRPRWAGILPLAGLVVAAAMVQRNAAVAAMVAVTVAAPGLAGFGSLRGQVRNRATVMLAVALGVGGLGMVGAVLDAEAFAFETYPEELLEQARSAGLMDADRRPFHPDTVGNYSELRYGADGSVFMDDRVEFYPPGLIDIYLIAGAGGDAALEVLDGLGSETVLWPDDSRLSAALDSTGEWERFGTSESADQHGWAVWCRSTMCP